MRVLLPLLMLVAGLTATVLFAMNIGIRATADSIASIGWLGFLAVCAVHLLVAAICGWAWFALSPPARPRFLKFAGVRLVRNGAGEILPFSDVGGVAIGMRAISLAGLSGDIAIASTIVDVALEVLGLLVFTVLALGLLVAAHPELGLAIPFAAGLAAATAIGALLLVLLRWQPIFLETIAERARHRLLRKLATGAAGVRSAVGEICSRRGALVKGFALHFSAWILGALESWLLLAFAGKSLGVGPVLAIEGLLCAARSAAFLVPSGIGVQEGAYVFLGSIFGLTPEVALALSLLKRARDLALGLPAIFAWQIAETRRVRFIKFGRRPLSTGPANLNQQVLP